MIGSIRLIGDKILVRPVEEKYRGILVIPPNVKKNPIYQGEVVAFGPGLLMKNGGRWPMPDIKVGDIIVFSKDGALRVEIHGEKFITLHGDQVEAIIEVS